MKVQVVLSRIVACRKSFVAQWLTHVTGVWKVIGSILARDSDFFFVSRS